MALCNDYVEPWTESEDPMSDSISLLTVLENNCSIKDRIDFASVLTLVLSYISK